MTGTAREKYWKITGLMAGVFLTVSIHYGWVLEPLFGHHDWVHAVHSRLCYIPIVVGAAWFGLRGGLAAAAAIAILIQPFIWVSESPHLDVFEELLEIVFYFAIGALVGWLVDREGRIRARQEQAERELERSQRLSLMGQMAAGVAHEIKNPLTSIQGAVEIINAPATSQSEREEFQAIVAREIGRIDRTVREFLGFARPRPFAPTMVDLSALITSGLRQMEAQLKQRGITLHADVMPGIVITGDAERLMQVMMNLLLNAIEASSVDSKISVSLRSDDRCAHLRLTDQGRGMSAEEMSHAFEPFFTTKPSGSGLGLATVRTIIDEHQGTISITSAPGEGTTFDIHLPRGRV